eukprot:4437632-Pleurochrysis_carterae.AAC.1
MPVSNAVTNGPQKNAYTELSCGEEIGCPSYIRVRGGGLGPTAAAPPDSMAAAPAQSSRLVWTRSEAECWQRAEVTLLDDDKLTLYLPETREVRTVKSTDVCEVRTHRTEMQCALVHALRELAGAHICRMRSMPC